MLGAGSQQLRLFRRAIRDGATLEQACVATGNIISLEEGKIYLAWDAKNPPSEECFNLLYDPNAKERTMAKTATKEDGEGAGISGEYKRPDAAGAIEIYRDEVAGKLEHMATIKGDLSDPYKRIKDECNFPRKVLDLLMQLDDMEDAKRQHWLLAFSEGCKVLNIRIEADLVTMANGEEAGGDVVPTGKRASMKLVGIDDEDEFDEASEEELSQQEGRNGSPDDEEELSEAAE